MSAGKWHNVRLIEGEWHMRCDSCQVKGRGTAWWPLTLEFWDEGHGLTRCRACWLVSFRRQHAASSARNREAIRAKSRAYYRLNAEVMRMKERQRYWERKAAVAS